MGFEIDEFDITGTGPRFDSVLRLFNDLQAERDPDIDPFTPAGLRADHLGTERFERRLLVAFDGDEALGVAQLWIHHMEANDDKAEVDLSVHPEHRRRGIGSAILHRTAAECAAIGRTMITTFMPDGEPAQAFHTSLGLERRMLERESRLWLAETDPEMMEAWVAGRAERAGDYRLIHWRGPTPEEHIDAMATLMTAMNDAPLDDLDWDDDTWTPEIMRDLDSYFVRRGFERWASIVFAPDGSPAGLTAISLDTNRPRFAHQGDTVTIDSHRGRGIGRWIKADMWQRMRADAPETAAIDTGNAESNDPMLAINVAMGFRPLVGWGGWQATSEHFLNTCKPAT